MSVRKPTVAGAFYPADPQSLRQSVESSFTHKLGPGKPPEEGSKERSTVSIVCPHAGYMYSGPVAAHGYYSISLEKKPKSIVIIGPNHTGLGSAVALMGRGAWRTPLGVVNIDEELADAIVRSSDMIDIDELAHAREHSIEVQLPFLQYIYGNDFGLVPICMGLQDLDTSREIGRAIAEAVGKKDTLIIASTDMTHYESQASAYRKDRMVIEAVIALDEEALQRNVQGQGISMCGFGPVSAAIVASKLLGAERGELLAYHTSGDVTGDHSAVVGYASLRISR